LNYVGNATQTRLQSDQRRRQATYEIQDTTCKIQNELQSSARTVGKRTRNELTDRQLVGFVFGQKNKQNPQNTQVQFLKVVAKNKKKTEEKEINIKRDLMSNYNLKAAHKKKLKNN